MPTLSQSVTHLVDKGTLLSNIEPSILLCFATLNGEESCVFVLVPQATLVASEDGLGIKPVMEIQSMGCHQQLKCQYHTRLQTEKL